MQCCTSLLVPQHAPCAWSSHHRRHGAPQPGLHAAAGPPGLHQHEGAGAVAEQVGTPAKRRRAMGTSTDLPNRGYAWAVYSSPAASRTPHASDHPDIPSHKDVSVTAPLWRCAPPCTCCPHSTVTLLLHYTLYGNAYALSATFGTCVCGCRTVRTVSYCLLPSAPAWARWSCLRRA